MKEYYNVSQIDQTTYLIFEKKGVSCYLLLGKEKAMLIDTGFGNPSLLPTIRKITKKPLIVVNSHIHPDHCGGNAAFGTVYAPAADIAAPPKKFLFDELMGTVRDGMKKRKRPKNLFFKWVVKNFTVDETDWKFRPIPEQGVFRLGGRDVEVLPCPGHTPGSVMLLDKNTKTVFAGDTLGLWLFTDPAQKLEDYIARMKKVEQLEGFETVWMSHVPHPKPFGYIHRFVEFLEDAKNQNAKKFHLPGFEQPLLVLNKKDEQHGFFSLWRFADQ